MSSLHDEIESIPAPFTVDEATILRLVKRVGIRLARAYVSSTREQYDLDGADEIAVKPVEPDITQDYPAYCAGFVGKSPESFKGLTSRQALAHALGHASAQAATLLSRSEVTAKLDLLMA